MNDLPNSVEGTKIKMNADDTNLIKQFTSLHVHLIMWFMLRKLFPAQQILQWPFAKYPKYQNIFSHAVRCIIM